MKTYICKNKADNLCDTCKFCIADCSQDVEFGDGIGNDNVVECAGYYPGGEIPENVEVINE